MFHRAKSRLDVMEGRIVGQLQLMEVCHLWAGVMCSYL